MPDPAPYQFPLGVTGDKEIKGEQFAAALKPADEKMPMAAFFNAAVQGFEKNPNLPVQHRYSSALESRARLGVPVGEAVPELVGQFGIPENEARSAYSLRREHAYFADKEPSTTELANLRSIPFVSAIGTTGMANQYKEARDRIAKGEAREGDPNVKPQWNFLPDPGESDYRKVARYERLMATEAKQRSTLEGDVTASLAHMPAMLLEAYTGGKAGTLVGRIPAVSRFATKFPKVGRALGLAEESAVAEEGAPSIKSIIGLQNIATKEGAKTYAKETALDAVALAVRTPGQTAAMPSMYLPQSAERAIEKGGDWSDVDNLGRSYAIANLQVAVLGRLGPAGDAIPAGGPGAFGTRLAVRTGTGMLEQQAVDSIAQATGLQDRKGTLYEAVNGEPGSLKNATTEAITFAAFSLMHGAPQKKGLKPKPLEIDPAKAQQAAAPIVQTIESLKAQGQTPQQIGDAMQGVHQKVDAALVSDPTLTKDQARKLFENDSPEIQKYAEVKIATLPDKKIPIHDSSLPAKSPVEPVKPSSEWTDPNAVVEPSDHTQAFDKLSPAVQKELAASHGVPVEAFRGGAAPWYRETLRKHLEEVAKSQGQPAYPKSVTVETRPSRKTIDGEKLDVHTIHDESGKLIGDIHLVPRGKELNVQWVGAKGVKAGEVANVVGRKNLRSVLEQIAAKYPEAEYLTGTRIGGARMHAGKTDQRVNISLPGRGPQRRKGESNHEPPKAPDDPFNAPGLADLLRKPSGGPETAPEAPKPADLPTQEPATAPKAEPTSAVPEQKPVVPPADVTSKANTSAERVGERKNVPPTEKARERVADLLKESGVAIKQAEDFLARFEGKTLEEIAKARGVSKQAVDQSIVKALTKLELDKSDIDRVLNDGLTARGAGILERTGDGRVLPTELRVDPRETKKQSRAKQDAGEREIKRLDDLLEKLDKGELSREDFDAELDRIAAEQRPARPAGADRPGASAEAPPERPQAPVEPPAKDARAEAPAPTVVEQRIMDVFDKGSESLKDHVEAQLSNLGLSLDMLPGYARESEDHARHVGRRLVSSWVQMVEEKAPAKDVRDLEAIMRKAVPDLKPTGKVGDKVGYDGLYHEGRKDVFTGDKIEVVRPGWSIKDDSGREYVVLKAETKPAEGKGVLFAPPSTPSPAGTPQAPGPQVGQHDIVQKIRKDFDVPSYRDTPPFGSQSDAAYWTKHMAQITGNMAAGSAQKGIHEAAHHLATKYDLPDDPAQLGPGIAAGFKQFDYVPNRPNAKVAIQEGFAEWMRRYATDDLKNLTKEQQEAAFFAEAFLAMKGQAKKLDGIREQFRDFAKQNPIQKAAGELSGTGSIPEPGDTIVQRVKDLSHRIDDAIWDDLAVWDRVEADRVKSGLAPTPADKNPRLVYSQLRMRNGDTAAEIEQKGYFTIQNGKRVFTGRGLDHVLEPWTKEDMAPLGSKATSILGKAKGFFEDPKRISKAEVFLIANHVLGEVSRGKRPVSQDQIDLFQEAMKEFMKDPEFMKRATEGAKRYTENMNDGLRALASPEIHRLEPDQADYHIKDKPDYVPLNRVKEQENWQAVGGRSKGEFMPNPVKARKGSGEQIVSPFVSLRMKALERASQINEQMRRNAAMELLLSGGLGKYALPGMEQQVADKAGNVYDTHEPWPTDGTKPSFWWAGPGGKMTNVRIGDRALYDLLTNQQVESSQLAKLARAYSGLTVSLAGKEVRPVELIGKLVRGGATALNLGFQLKNVPRDVYTFLSNTQSQASVASLPKAYGQMYLYELAKLFQMVSGKDVADPVAKLFAEGRGGQMRQFAFEPSRPQSAYDRTQGGIIQKARNLVDIGKQLLTVAGAGELGPRYQEFKNELKKRGWDEGKLRSELNAAEAQRKAGGNYVEPVPLGDLFAAYDAAAEVTVPFGRQGTLTRELNKITPFFGPGVAGLSKQIRNWKSNPKGAAAAMGVLMGLRLLYWSMYHDEDWYGELSDYDRYNNFVVPIPGLGLRRLPGPRGLEVGVGGTLTSVLDASVGKNPRVGGLVSQSLQANLPPGIDRPAGSLAKGDYASAAGEAAVAPLGPAGETGLDLVRNKDFTGRPIVPTRDENLPMRTKLTEKYLPYAVQQLSGGRGEPTLRGAGLEPVPQVKPKESVNVFYDTLKGMESERELAKKRGLKFEDEKKYDQMKKAEAKMTKLNAEARGEKRVGDKTVKIPVPDERRKDEIRLELIRLAKEALK